MDTNPNVKFMTITELKLKLNVDKIAMGWSKRGKLVALVNGTFIKCQQDLDVTKPMSYLYEVDKPWHEGCIVNVVPTTVDTLEDVMEI